MGSAKRLPAEIIAQVDNSLRDGRSPPRFPKPRRPADGFGVGQHCRWQNRRRGRAAPAPTMTGMAARYRFSERVE
jgi:hypothetical protein